MFEIASQIVLCLLLAALLGAIIGYLLGKSTCGKSDTCQKEPDTSHELHINHQANTDVQSAVSVNNAQEEVEEVITSKPLLLTEAREGGKDNLQLIKGIGEVIEKTLNEQGIYHFDQIANWTNEERAWIDNAISFPGRAERENWVEQAKVLSEGGKTEFAERVEQGEVPSSKQS